MYKELVYRVHFVRAEENALTVNVEINVFKCEEIKRTATFYTTGVLIYHQFSSVKKSLMVINQQAKLFLHKCCPRNDSAN
jgi:hypothetical protein